MKTQLLPNEQIICEIGGSRIGITMLTKGGKIILTNMRLLYEALLTSKLEVEINLQDIESFRKSYATGVGQILPLPNAIDVVTNNEVYKFQMNGRDGFLKQLNIAAPHAEYSSNETYGASVVSVGARVVSGVKNAVTNQPIPSSKQNQPYIHQTVSENKNCTYCNAINSSTSNFCNECGQKMQQKCPTCDTLCVSGEKFCGQCGTKITQ